MAVYVLDTSAIFAFLGNEDGSSQVANLLRAAERQGDTEPSTLLIAFVALMEVEYWLRRTLSPGEVESTLGTLEAWPAAVRESTPAWRREAARVKATTPLSVADASIASLALLEGATLVHKDPEFDRVDGLQALRLPYKTRPV